MSLVSFRPSFFLPTPPVEAACSSLVCSRSRFQISARKPVILMKISVPYLSSYMIVTEFFFNRASTTSFILFTFILTSDATHSELLAEDEIKYSGAYTSMCFMVCPEDSYKHGEKEACKTWTCRAYCFGMLRLQCLWPIKITPTP